MIPKTIFCILLGVALTSALNKTVTITSDEDQDILQITINARVSKDLLDRIERILAAIQLKIDAIVKGSFNEGSKSMAKGGLKGEFDLTAPIQEAASAITNSLKETKDENFKKLMTDLKELNDVLKNKVSVKANITELRSITDVKQKYLKLKHQINQILVKVEAQLEHLKNKGTDAAKKTLNNWQNIKNKILKLADEAGSAIVEIKSVVDSTYNDIKEFLKKENIKVEIKE